MNRFQTWFLLTVAAFLGVLIGTNSLESAGDCTWFSGWALALHWFCGEDT